MLRHEPPPYPEALSRTRTVRRSPLSPARLLAGVMFLLLLLGAGVMLGFIVAAWQQNAPPPLDPTATARPITPPGDLADDEKATIELFRKCSSSVVYITAVAVRRDRLTFNPIEIPHGTGSGFVWDEKGHIVTNFHVVANAVNSDDQIRVTLADQTSHLAEVIGVAPDNDLAVLRLQSSPESLSPIPVGSSAELQVGQKVLAIGNPFGLDQTLTTGVISGLGREIKADNGRTIFDVIQTDAAINPGNSGGPLLDSSGRMIGVNTAIYSPSGAYAGIGFAIPVDTVNRVVPQLLRYGQVIRPGFGIQIAPDQVVRQLGVEGVLILKVQSGGAAEEAGLQPTVVNEQDAIVLGDVIVSVDGERIRTSDDLFQVLEHHAVGDSVAVELLRHLRTPNETTIKQGIRLKALP